MATLTASATRVVPARPVLHWVAVHSLAVAVALFFVLPFVFVLLTAVMTDQQTLTRTCGRRPGSGQLRRCLAHRRLPTWWRNTMLYATVGTALTLVSSIPVAYALAHFRFRGRNLAMMVVVSR